MKQIRHTGPPRRCRLGLLVVGALVGTLLAGTAHAASYYEKTRPYHFSSGGLSAGSGVDVATGALRLSTSLGRLQGRLPIECGWQYNAQDGTIGPLGTGTSTSYDWFIEWDGGGAYQVVGPGNRRYPFKPNGVNGQWTDTRDPEMLGAVLNMPDPPVYGQELVLRFKNGTQFSFNGWGSRELLRVLNPHGYGAYLIYRNGSGFPTKILQSPAYADRYLYVGFGYNANNKLASMTFNVDAGGVGSLNRTWSFGYDLNGRLSTVTAPDNTVTQYSWTTYTRDDGQVLPLLASITNPRGYVALANLFDSLGRVTRQTFADNAFLTLGYSAAIGSPGTTTLTDPRGNVSSWNYAWVSDPWYTDKFGYTISSTTDALNRTTTYERNAAPTTLLTAQTDFRGRRVTMSWDTARGNLLSTTRPTASGGTVTSSATYEPNYSVLTSTTDAGGRQTVYTVTGSYGEVTAIRDPRNNTSTLTYDINTGDLLSATNALNQASSYSYGGIPGVLLTATDPAGHVTSRSYDGAARPLSVTDANNKTTSYTYDLMDRVKSVSRVVNGQTLTTLYEYDSNGNRTALVDPKNQRWEWSFDSRDRVIQDKNPLLQTRSYSYDGNSNLLVGTDRLGQRWENAYTTGDRIASQTFKRADSTVEATVTYSYSPTTYLLSSVTDSLSGATSWSYDAIDRILTEAGPSGTLTFTLDDLNRRTGLQVPGQAAIAYGFDNNDNLVSITQGTGTTAFTRDALNRATLTSLPNSVTTERAFDNAGFLTSLVSKKSGAAFDSHSYLRDALGNITQETVNGATNSYGYDDLYRLVSSTVSGTASSWSYDQVGNRLTQVVGGVTTSYTYNSANRLLTVNGAAVTSNANGSVTAYGTDAYTWDVRNRLKTLTRTGATYQFGYRPDGLRASKTVNGTATTYLLNGDSVVTETTGGTSKQILQGPGVDQILARDGKWFVPNHLGSTVALTDAAGNVTQAYGYKPFGELTNSPTDPNPFQFTGRENDGTGLMYYRARYYAPQWGRFISEDPIGFAGGINQYAYASNNPVNRGDTAGLRPYNPEDRFGGASVFDGEAGGMLLGIGAAPVAGFVPIDGEAEVEGGALGFGGRLASEEAAPRVPIVIGEGEPEYGDGGTGGNGQLELPFIDLPPKINRPRIDVDKHHITPQYLGGDPNGPLGKWPPSVHRAFHTELDQVFPRKAAKDGSYIGLDPELRDVILGELYQHYPPFQE